MSAVTQVCFLPKSELFSLCSLAFTCPKVNQEFGKVTDLMSSHLGIQVGEDIEKQRPLSWSSPVPYSPLAQTLGPQFYA